MGDRGTEALQGVDLEVRAGEIVGLAGVSGNGQRELAQCMSGLRTATAGTILMEGKDIAHSLAARARRRPAWPTCRKSACATAPSGTSPCRRTSSCTITPRRSSPTASSWTSRRWPDHAGKLVKQFAVKTASLDTPIKNLSGGNIQKVILARELSRNPHVLIAAQPTRGVDIGATEYIHQRLMEQRAAGTAILLISEDLDEIRTLSDRIAVIYEGKIMGMVDRGEATVEEIGLMMAGIPADNAVGREPCP